MTPGTLLAFAAALLRGDRARRVDAVVGLLKVPGLVAVAAHAAG